MSKNLVNSFVQSMRDGDMINSREAIQQALYSKISTKLDEMRTEVANKVFNTPKLNEENDEEDCECQHKNGEDEENFT